MSKNNQERFVSELLAPPQLREALGQRALRNADARFHDLQVSSARDLLEVYPTLSPSQKFVALLHFHRRRYRSAVPLLLRELSSANARIGGMASAALGVIGGHRVFSRLLAMLSESRIHSRLNATSALCCIREVPSKEALVRILSTILDDRSEVEDARAMAAEGLVNALYGMDRRRKVYRDAVRLLIHTLDDPAAEVRCCCVYALGQLRVSAATRKLKEMAAHDHACCPGIGPISSEAIEAISFIED